MTLTLQVEYQTGCKKAINNHDTDAAKMLVTLDDNEYMVDW